MTNTIPNVPRELLEVIEQTWRINYRGGPVTTDLAADAIEKGLGQLRAILSAPSPAGVDGLEVVAQVVIDPNGSNKRVIFHSTKALNELPVWTKLSVTADAQAIIDGLRGEVAKINSDRLACWAEFKVMTRACLDAEKERDQQAQRIGELEGLLREVAATLAWIAHGECRAIHDGPIMPSQMAIDAVKAALGGSL